MLMFTGMSAYWMGKEEGRSKCKTPCLPELPVWMARFPGSGQGASSSLTHSRDFPRASSLQMLSQAPFRWPWGLASSFLFALRCWKQLSHIFLSEGSFLRLEYYSLGFGSQQYIFNLILWEHEMESSRMTWKRGPICKNPVEEVTLVPGCLAGCLDQAESTTSHGPMRRESMKLLKESVQLYFEQCWYGGAFHYILFPRGMHNQKIWELHLNGLLTLESLFSSYCLSFFIFYSCNFFVLASVSSVRYQIVIKNVRMAKSNFAI